MRTDDSLPEDPSITCHITMYYYDTDAGGVVHNIAYLRHIEEARTRLAAHLGWSLQAMAEGTLAPVVRRTEIEYLSPARLGDVVEIHAKLLSLGGARFDVGFEIFRSKDDHTLLVTCRQTLVCVNLQTMRPGRVPSEWRNKWPHLNG